MRGSFFKLIFAVFIATVGVFGLQQSAHAQATNNVCFDNCFNANANNTNLTCCGSACDARTYCDQVCLCGNGQINAVCDVLEQCDDGNRVDGDGCSSTCHTTDVTPPHENCGDGVLNEDCGDPEECDDGNHRNGDGCDANCVREARLPGADAPTLPKVKYRDINTDDLLALRDTIVKDLNIQPGDAVVPSIKGYGNGPIAGNLTASVMPKWTAALQSLFRALFPNFNFGNTVVMSNPIGCTYSRDFCFTIPPPPGGTTPSTICSKGCQEVKPAQWSAGNQCFASMGCCTNTTVGCLLPRPAAPAVPDNPGTSDVDESEPPISADSIRGNGIY